MKHISFKPLKKGTSLLCVALVLLSIILNCFLLVSLFKQKKELSYIKNNQFSPAKAKQDSLDYSEKQNKENLPYSKLYPNLKAPSLPNFQEEEEKVCYLTFDDGPSKVTLQILDTLDKYDAKATFFVTGQKLDDPNTIEILQEVAKRGHTIGLHSYSHSYKQIYSSVEAYLEDLNRLFEAVKTHTGVEPSVVRFPGGSINSNNQHLYQELISEISNRGFVIYDWNISAGDAELPQKSASTISSNVISHVEQVKRPIVLFHDDSTKKQTAAALPSILSYLQEHDYQVKGLDNTVYPVFFHYKH